MKTLWKFDIKGSRSVAQRSPILSRNHVIVTRNHGLDNFQGVILALCVETGEEKWRFERPHYFSQPVISNDGSIFATGFDGMAHKLAPDGQLLWSTAVSERNLWSGISQAGKFIFSEIGGMSQSSWALDAETGEVDWRYENGGHSYGLAFDHARSVIVSTASRAFDKTYGLHHVDIKTGQAGWKTTYPEILFGPFVFQDVIITGSRGRIAAFRLADGSLLAERTIDAAGDFNLNVFALHDRVFLASNQGHIVALSVERTRSLFGRGKTGLSSVWEIRLGNGVDYFCLEQGHLICLTTSGDLCMIDPVNGSQVKNARLPHFEKGMGITSVAANSFVMAVNRTCSRIEL